MIRSTKAYEDFCATMQVSPWEVHPNTVKAISAFLTFKCTGQTVNGRKGEDRGVSTASRLRSAISNQFIQMGHHGQFEKRGSRYVGNPTTDIKIVRLQKAIRRDHLSRHNVSRQELPVNHGHLFQLFVQAKMSNNARRLQLHCMMVFAFKALLRVNELCNLRKGDISLIGDRMRPLSFALQLYIRSPRKADQECERDNVFVLHQDFDSFQLCPLLAFSDYVRALSLSMTQGRTNELWTPPVTFPDWVEGANGEWKMQPSTPMSPESFRKHMRQVMTRIPGVPDASRYGTHSFRRGGAQYFYHVLRWPRLLITAYGGWADSKDASILFRYLFGFDDPTFAPEVFRNSSTGPEIDALVGQMARMQNLPRDEFPDTPDSSRIIGGINIDDQSRREFELSQLLDLPLRDFVNDEVSRHELFNDDGDEEEEEEKEEEDDDDEAEE